ncbi:hypothetical protein CSOJ01_04619 [Colletotrichum sojae]|uniref:Uncharacterized protein n=1 Tax=Colletotrichum sojae TaxID=2175907 RepID=A0A8H6JIY6_9PEZI|nr:hypothetical protein CSOJ01_04619 [Colletotrichum sojae]
MRRRSINKVARIGDAETPNLYMDYHTAYHDTLLVMLVLPAAIPADGLGVPLVGRLGLLTELRDTTVDRTTSRMSLQPSGNAMHRLARDWKHRWSKQTATLPRKDASPGTMARTSGTRKDGRGRSRATTDPTEWFGWKGEYEGEGEGCNGFARAAMASDGPAASTQAARRRRDMARSKPDCWDDGLI